VANAVGQSNAGYPVVRAVAYLLVHVPGLVAHGSKPSRELARHPELGERIQGGLRSFDEAVAYPPNQVFIGNLRPDELGRIPRPWPRHALEGAVRRGRFGEIMPEEEFLGLLKAFDEFDLVVLDAGFAAETRRRLQDQPLATAADLERIGAGVDAERLAEIAGEPGATALRLRDGSIAGCVRRGHEEDLNLTADLLLENLAVKATGALVLRQLFALPCAPRPDTIDYLLGCGEEASGDRYQRGGGSLAKAMAPLAGCDQATGSDLKAYCCAPIHALVLGGAMVRSGLAEGVVVVGGGSLAKLGMKFQGHLRAGVPVMEDVLAATAVLLGPDDGSNPVLRLDVSGRHPVGAASGPQVMADHLVRRPLARAGLRITDVDKYALEMHDPDVTETAGSGNVPRNNYRIVGSLAAIDGEIDRTAVGDFERAHGMPGFSPTQGHIAAAIPFLGHARQMMLDGEIERAMFVAKGSLFLGRMTQLSDGMSIMLERNPRNGGFGSGQPLHAVPVV
jgi:hypothetical protein